MSSSIRQFEEKVVPNEISLMKWSDRMDLLVLANTKGEVYLHRLTWQRVWCLPSNPDGSYVTDITWRPDGKIIAIAYSSGQVVLVEVENKNILHTINVEDQVTCLAWQQEKERSNIMGDYSSRHAASMGNANKYLPNLVSLAAELSSAGKNQTEDLLYVNFVQSQNDLNIFIIGTKSGMLLISIFGLFNCARINVRELLGKNCTILNAHLSQNMDLLYVTLCDRDHKLGVSIINTSVLKTHVKELFGIALKHCHLYSMLSYLESIMSAINEAWESILLEMDSKLSKYASNVPEGTVSADFLDLLMFGIPSDEMEEFLMHDLTDKGLKKLGQSIELSYSNIQKLLHKHLSKVGQSITYHLTELRGMARFTYRYKKLGLNESTVSAALRMNGAFLVKGIEVQQVINHSMTNYKAFFRWLYVVILRMMDEQIPPEIPKMAQQDLAYIVEFLQNFDSIGRTASGKRNRFNLERLGQYLIDAPLKIVATYENNLWYEFLDENECVAEEESIIKFYENRSLVQQHKCLIKSIEEIFFEPKEYVSSNFKFRMSFACLQITNKQNLCMTQLNYDDNITCIAFVDTELLTDGVFFLEMDNSGEFKTKCLYLYASQVPEIASEDCSTGACKIVDVKFYSPTYISLLFQDMENDIAYICQTPIAQLRPFLTEANLHLNTFILDPEIGKVDISDIVGNIVKKIEGMLVSSFAVSGSRHVSAVLSDNQRKVHLYEMEADEEDDELDDTYLTANTTRDDSMLQETASVE